MNMPHYEHIFLVRQDVSATQVEALGQQFKTILEENGGSVEKSEYWGIKPLSFRIRKNRKAHFTLINVTAPPAAVKEMERQMAINEDVVRFMTIRVDEHEEGPSAMMRQSRGRDRDDRGPRRDRGDRPERSERRADSEKRPGDEAPEAPAAKATSTKGDA